MALLSRTDQLEVDRAKDGIEDLQEQADNLQGFANGFVLWIRDLDRFAERIADTEVRLAALIETYFGSGTPETKALVARMRIGELPSPATEDQLHRKFDRNIARARDALQDGIKLLEEKITALRQGRNPVTQPADTLPTKEPIVVLKPTLWGMSIDLRALWRTLRRAFNRNGLEPPEKTP
jgi:hypothetical protein